MSFDELDCPTFLGASSSSQCRWNELTLDRGLEEPAVGGLDLTVMSEGM